MKRTFDSAFTLIELMVTIAIIGMLITLAAPNFGRVRERAESIKCAANLSSIGVALQGYLQDNDNRYPEIEPMPSNPVYSSGGKAGSLLSVLGPYGVSEATVRCPTDARGPNYFKKEGSSYMWRPYVDDELALAPKIYRRNRTVVPPPNRIPLLTDYDNYHHGHINALFADGHVRSF